MKTFSFLLLLALAVYANADDSVRYTAVGDYYLSPDGGSTNCLKNNPCATMADIVNVIPRGEASVNIIAAEGTYSGSENFDVSFPCPVVVSAQNIGEAVVFDGSDLIGNQHFWIDPTESVETYQIVVKNVPTLIRVNETNSIQIEDSLVSNIDNLIVGPDFKPTDIVQKLSISYSTLENVEIHATTKNFYAFQNQVHNCIFDFHDEGFRGAGVINGNFTDSVVLCDGYGKVENNMFTFTDDFPAPVVKFLIPVLLSLNGDSQGWNITGNTFSSTIRYAAVDFNSRGLMMGNIFNDPSDIFFNADNWLDGFAYADSIWAIIDSEFTDGQQIHVSGGYISIQNTRFDSSSIDLSDSDDAHTPQMKGLIFESYFQNSNVSFHQTRSNIVGGFDYQLYSSEFVDSMVSIYTEENLPLSTVYIKYNTFSGGMNGQRAVTLTGTSTYSKENVFSMTTAGGYLLTNSSLASEGDIFDQNMADNGAAILMDSCTSVITDATFTNNVAENYAGGIYLKNAMLKIDNSDMNNNSAHYGGVFFMDKASTVILGNEASMDGNNATTGVIATCTDVTNKIYFGLGSLTSGDNDNLGPAVLSSDIYGCYDVGNLFIGPQDEENPNSPDFPCGTSGTPCSTIKRVLDVYDNYGFQQLIISIINCHEEGCIFIGDNNNFGNTFPDVPVTIRFYEKQSLSLPEPIFKAINTSDPFAIVSNDLTLLGIRIINPQGPLINAVKPMSLVLSYSNVNVERLMLSQSTVPTLNFLFIKKGSLKQNTQVLATGGVYFYNTELYHDLFDLFILNDGEYNLSGMKVTGDMLLKAGSDSIILTIDHAQYYSSNAGFDGFDALYFIESQFQNSHVDLFDNINFVEFLVVLFSESPATRNSVLVGDIDSVVFNQCRFVRSNGVALVVSGPSSNVFIFGSTFKSNRVGSIISNNTQGSIWVRRSFFLDNQGTCLTAIGGNVTVINIQAIGNIGTVIDHTYDDDDGGNSQDDRHLVISDSYFDNNRDPYAIVRGYNIQNVMVSNVTFTNNRGDREGFDFRYFQDLVVQSTQFTHNHVTNLDLYSNSYFANGRNPTITLTDLLFFDNEAQYTSCIDCNCNGCTFDITDEDVILIANEGPVVDCPGFSS